MKYYIDADRLKAEIKRRIDATINIHHSHCHRREELEGLLSFIDSLQQEQPNAYEDAMLEVKEYVDKLYDNASIGLNEYDSGLYNGIAETCMKLRGFIKARTSRAQPGVDLEKAALNFAEEKGVLVSDTFLSIARHFFELGQRKAKEESK